MLDADIRESMDDRLTKFAEEPRLITEPGRAARVAHIATNRPAVAPAMPSTTLSQTNCRTS